MIKVRLTPIQKYKLASEEYLSGAIWEKKILTPHGLPNQIKIRNINPKWPHNVKYSDSKKLNILGILAFSDLIKLYQPKINEHAN